MSKSNPITTSDDSKTPSSNPYDFANFQMGPAGSVISILLKMNEIDLEIGQLDNELAALNNRFSSEEANAVSTLQQNQGKQQKIDQVLSGVGEISGGALSLASAVGSTIYASKASQSISPGEGYLKPIDQSGNENFLSTAKIQQDDIVNDPAVKTRIQQMKTNLDLTKTPDKVTTTLENGQTVTDETILKFADSKDVEAVQAQAKKQIDQRANEIKSVGEKIYLITPALKDMTTGSFSLAAANHKAIAKDDEAQATIAQNLISSFNSNQSLMQNQATNIFGLIPTIAQYIEQLLMANKYNGG
ncbi:hypothetical protein [Simkania negevensis]|uniref:Uncharacterized protein n=1 Tax=Simkania negevensis (strain ATCC VR-1471 / DSM 27360 / Z) TaxID=331113 RepID=F8L3Q1_SIMNZ|nr:hypothetical protein [Simkania negevensis]CCB89913.1 unknown protein [Simkania negevensis Z]